MVARINDIIPVEYFNIKDWYFAGGCVYSLWNGKEVKDYDIFAKNVAAIRKLRKWFRTNTDKASFTSKNAITMGKYQFIVKHIGCPEAEVAKFDFKHNMFYYDGCALHNVTDWDEIESSSLRFNTGRARDILNILTRVPKFVERGMDISQKEILDIIELGTRPTKIFSERRYIKTRCAGKSKY